MSNSHRADQHYENGARKIDTEFWVERKALVTGHMGFKGTWLTELLSILGARVAGYGKDDRSPLLYNEMMIERHAHNIGDICQTDRMRQVLVDSGAEILFHLAAQPIVLTSYEDPVGTFEDNIMGTVKVLEAARAAPNLKAVVIVTSDKVYHNNSWIWGYRESDTLGGSDPYSASKAAAEIVTASMIASFFNKPGMPRVATVRAGNVIGGGDWAPFRLLPDAARALGQDRALIVRNPQSTRPWQHVLDPLGGYVMLAEDLAHAATPMPRTWNFGPAMEDALPVCMIADLFVSEWGNGASWRHEDGGAAAAKEATLLAVDSTQARRELGWSPTWRVQQAVARTSAWYRDYYAGADPKSLVDRDIRDFLAR
ncbi:MAG: CDP-glucose 4,6-dehydratase [Candidatus Devosia symbiotica]|nr:CDP-glucose 4,6-dehydratase [Candidatus Devosia symbiotica]